MHRNNETKQSGVKKTRSCFSKKLCSCILQIVY